MKYITLLPGSNGASLQFLLHLLQAFVGQTAAVVAANRQVADEPVYYVVFRCFLSILAAVHSTLAVLSF